MQRRAAQALPRAADWRHRVIVVYSSTESCRFGHRNQPRPPGCHARRPLAASASASPGCAAFGPSGVCTTCRTSVVVVPSEHLIGAQFGRWPAADRTLLRHRFRALGCAIPEIVEMAFVSLRLPSSPLTGKKANRETLYLSPCVERRFVIACDRSELLSQFFARGSDRTETAGCRSETSGSGRLHGAECGRPCWPWPRRLTPGTRCRSFPARPGFDRRRRDAVPGMRTGGAPIAATCKGSAHARR